MDRRFWLVSALAGLLALTLSPAVRMAENPAEAGSHAKHVGDHAAEAGSRAKHVADHAAEAGSHAKHVADHAAEAGRGLAAITQAQAESPAPDLVPVMVRVLDRGRQPVTDLKADDFAILEDGVRQDIRHFALEVLQPGTAPADAKLAIARGASLARQGHRVFLFALGFGRLETGSNAITELLSFVRTRLLPQDLVGVFAYNRALPFTTDHARVVDLLERVKRVHEDVDFEVAQQMGPLGMAPLYGSRVLPRRLQARIDAMMFGPGGHATAPAAADNLGPDEFDGLSLDDFAVSSAVALRDEVNLHVLAEYLRHFEGEKHLLFVTEKGLLWPNEEDDRALAALANEGRLSIHTLQVGGLLAVDRGKDLEATQQQARSFASLRTISELTGGLSAVTEPSRAALERLDGVTRTGYLLGYRSSRAAWDGRPRAIAVRVNRPDVTVLYPHGYRRERIPAGFDRRAFVTNTRLWAAAGFRREITDIKVKASTSVRAGRLTVEGTINLSRVKLDLVEGARSGLLNLAVFYFDSGWNPLGSETELLPLLLTEDQYKQAVKGGVPYVKQFPLTRDTVNVRFIVYDYSSDLVGRVDRGLVH